MIVYRHCDPRFPFLWESADQPPGRWHGEGEGPAHYVADTPDGAWAEFLRHEGIRELEDLAGIRRALWAIELGKPPRSTPRLPDRIVRGGLDSYPRCQSEARRLRKRGARGLRAPSAALTGAEAAGWAVSGGLKPAPSRAATVYALFGQRPDLVGWAITEVGRPPLHVLTHIRHL